MDPVTICNLALGWVGANRIHALNENDPQSVEEELCLDNFPLAVRTALEEKPWLFATGSNLIDLGAPEVTNDPNFPTRFAIPPEICKVRLCVDADGEPVEFEVRNGYVVTEEITKVFALATIYIDDPNKWTPTFCRAVAAQIASDLAPVLAPERAGLDRKMEARYLDAISKAGVFDLGQSSAVKIRKSSPLMSRR